ncbi:MAG: MerC domain-containing protein [Bryobacteraceae bacterium]
MARPSLLQNLRSSDRMGMILALLCFIHCVAGPLLLSIVGLAGLIGASEKLDAWFLGGSFVITTISLIPGYRRHHGRLTCLALFVLGITSLGLRHRINAGLVPVEVVATALGAGLIAAAHALNLQSSRRCPCCESTQTLTSAATRARSGPASC